jgi:hypothetical protein
MDDAGRLNVIGADRRYHCPVCGLAGVFASESYDAQGSLIGTGICPSCLWEPGFDDDPAASGVTGGCLMQFLRAYRARWIGAGWPWRGQADRRPAGWNGKEQLARLLLSAPHLR